jgi:hypothetical protein
MKPQKGLEQANIKSSQASFGEGLANIKNNQNTCEYLFGDYYDSVKTLRRKITFTPVLITQ